ncbi:PAS domain S-box protein [Pseudomonadota bacterium]
MGNLMHPNRIAWKIIKALIVFSSLLTLIATAYQLWTEYDRDVDAIDSRFVLVERSYIDSIAENVWEADAGRLDLLIKGIIEFPDFKAVIVRDDFGEVLAQSGGETGERVISKVYPLHYTFRGNTLKIGELAVTASLDQVYNRTMDRVWLILLSNAIKTFLVAVFMFALVYWLLTRHLDVMAQFARTMDFSLTPESLRLDRGALAGKPDEMDQLAESLNDMQRKLFRSYEELRTFSDDLEDRVRDRTRELRSEIEHRKITAEKLAESEARQRDIAESGSDWMWEMGPDLRFTHISGGAVRNGVLDKEAVVGRHRSEFAADVEDREKWEQHLEDLEAHKPFRDFEYKLKTPHGNILHVRVSGKPIFSDDGEFLGYRGISTNITEQVEAEQRAIKAQEDLHVLSSAVQQNPSAVFITDKDGIIQYVNEKFVSLTGYGAAEAVGQNPRILKSPDTPSDVHKAIWHSIVGGEEWRGEIQDRRKDGEMFWAYAIIAPVKNPAGEITHFIATHEDITDRKLAEENLRDVTERAQVASRAKSELMANMSHELRTPLNAIIGFSDTMINGVFGPLENERYEEYMHDINDSGTHLLELINDILDVSAIEAGKLELRAEPLDVDVIARKCLKLVQHRADMNQVKLGSHIEKGLPGLLADERRVKQVLINLLSNAVKFTPEGGRVTLSVVTAPNGGLRLEVEDTGIGMDDKGIDVALTQFGQVDSKLARKYEGTGLGLPLTKSLMEAHKGTLDIRSRLGHGTTAVAQFPNERSITPDDKPSAEALDGDAATAKDGGKPTMH